MAQYSVQHGGRWMLDRGEVDLLVVVLVRDGLDDWLTVSAYCGASPGCLTHSTKSYHVLVGLQWYKMMARYRCSCYVLSAVFDFN